MEAATVLFIRCKSENNHRTFIKHFEEGMIEGVSAYIDVVEYESKPGLILTARLRNEEFEEIEEITMGLGQLRPIMILGFYSDHEERYYYFSGEPSGVNCMFSLVEYDDPEVEEQCNQQLPLDIRNKLWETDPGLKEFLLLEQHLSGGT